MVECDPRRRPHDSPHVWRAPAGCAYVGCMRAPDADLASTQQLNLSGRHELCSEAMRDPNPTLPACAQDRGGAGELRDACAAHFDVRLEALVRSAQAQE